MSQLIRINDVGSLEKFIVLFGSFKVVLYTPTLEPVGYWLGLGNGYVATKEEANRFEIDQRIMQILVSPVKTTYVLAELTDEQAALVGCTGDGPKAEPPIIELLFKEPDLDLIRLAPRNEVVRAIIMAKMLQMPPVEADSFDKLKDWVQATGLPTPSQPPKPAVTNRSRNFILPVVWTATEHGTCRYRQRVCSHQEHDINLDTVLDQAAGVSSFDGLLDSLLSEARGEGDDGDWEGDQASIRHEEYGRDEDDGILNIDVELEDLARARIELKNYLRENAPEVLERLEQNEVEF